MKDEVVEFKGRLARAKEKQVGDFLNALANMTARGVSSFVFSIYHVIGQLL